MTALDVWLVAILVTTAVALIAIAVFGLVLLVKGMIAYGRYELDAGERALKMQAIITDRVNARLAVVGVRKIGDGRGVADQPPDPNVRTTSIVDDTHEIERETNRLLADTGYRKRDEFTQPLPPEPVEL